VAQSRRIIERIDLLILAGATLALVLLIAPLRQIIGVPIGGSLLITILVIAGFTALVAIAIMALFQLIFKIISKFL
jgi:serine/threonine-protein kinase